jgi:hypothetical protein
MSKAIRRSPKIEKGLTIERARARGIVELCEQAIAAGGTLVLNPEDPFDEQSTFTPDMVYLLRTLKDFADHGTFHHDPKGFMSHFWRARQVREVLGTCQSKRYEDRFVAVAEALQVSEMTARRLIKEAGG